VIVLIRRLGNLVLSASASLSRRGRRDHSFQAKDIHSLRRSSQIQKSMCESV
jgi:hypothetical protein